MASCSDTQSNLASAEPNPTLHVNYTLGMVLGVDDLTQEFAYLANRDQWAVRELHGYGTLSGLAVRLEDTPNTPDGGGGPRVHVTAGSAAVPSGKLVCVPSEQCAVLNQWLATPENAGRVADRLEMASPLESPLASPLGSAGTLPLYLTLCYADCTTQPVPIPGDPCRSEDQLMADSRVADDYRLELRLAPPAQREHDAEQAYVNWLGQVPSQEASPLDALDPALEETWAVAIRDAVQAWLAGGVGSPIESPLDSPLGADDLASGPPPLGLTVAADHRPAFFALALRIWITEVRPLVQTRTCADQHRPEHDCLLLARLAVPVIWVGGSPTGAWQADGLAAAIRIDETDRPLLAFAGSPQVSAATGGPVPFDVLVDTPGGGPIPAPGPGGDRPRPLIPGPFRLPLVGSRDGVIVTERPDAIELSLPQPIAPGSSPAFAGLRASVLETADLLASGGLRLAIRSVDADVTPTPEDHCLICLGTDITVTLPSSAEADRGKVYVIKNATDSNRAIRIAAQAGDQLDGLAPGSTLPLGPREVFRCIADGVDNWYRL